APSKRPRRARPNRGAPAVADRSAGRRAVGGARLETHQRPHFGIHPLGRPVGLPHDLDVHVLHPLEPAEHAVGVVRDHRTGGAAAATGESPAPRPRPRTRGRPGAEAPDASPPRGPEAECRTPPPAPDPGTGPGRSAVPGPSAAPGPPPPDRSRTRRRKSVWPGQGASEARAAASATRPRTPFRIVNGRRARGAYARLVSRTTNRSRSGSIHNDVPVHPVWP